MTLLNAENFKPLSSAAATRPRDEFRVSVVANANEARPFFPLAHHLPAGAGPGMTGAKRCEPRVSVERDGDRITHIHVQCGCGQMIDLVCAYDEPAGNA